MEHHSQNSPDMSSFIKSIDRYDKLCGEMVLIVGLWAEMMRLTVVDLTDSYYHHVERWIWQEFENQSHTWAYCRWDGP